MLGLVLVLAATCGIGGYALYRSQLKVNADAVNAYLGAMRDQNYSAAYDKLCANDRAQGTSAEYGQAAMAARADGRGVRSFDITSVNTNSSNGVTGRTAGGTVTFTNGTTVTRTFGLGKENGTLCIDSGYTDLVRSSG